MGHSLAGGEDPAGRNAMMEDRLFDRVAGIAAFLSTGIWWFFLFFASQLRWSDMEEFVLLHRHPLMAVKYVVSAACFVFAIVALSGLYFRIRDRHRGLPFTALVFFFVGSAIDSVYRSIEGITVHFTWARGYLEAANEVARSSYLAKIETFNEVGEGVFVVFGLFFALSSLLFGFCVWGVHRALSAAFLAAGLFVSVAYSAAFLALPFPVAGWIFFELLTIFLYLTLGIWLIRDEPRAAPANPTTVSPA
jgi:hypothetical protein